MYPTVQARGWQSFRLYHSQQERLGVRFFSIHHTMDRESRLSSADPHEHGSHYALVLVWYPVLLQGQDVQEMDEGQFCPQDVEVAWMFGVGNFHQIGEMNGACFSRLYSLSLCTSIRRDLLLTKPS